MQPEASEKCAHGLSCTDNSLEKIGEENGKDQPGRKRLFIRK